MCSLCTYRTYTDTLLVLYISYILNTTSPTRQGRIAPTILWGRKGRRLRFNNWHKVSININSCKLFYNIQCKFNGNTFITCVFRCRKECMLDGKWNKKCMSFCQFWKLFIFHQYMYSYFLSIAKSVILAMLMEKQNNKELEFLNS